MNGDVIIFGAGIAGCAAATALLRHGMRPILLRARWTPVVPGIEALPPKADTVLEILGWSKLLTVAGAVRVEGFENGLDGGQPFIHAGRYWHVDRTRLASAVLCATVAAGAELIEIDQSVPAPVLTRGAPLIVGERPFSAALDATGRPAAWIGRRTRYGREVADLYTLPESGEPSSEIDRGAIVPLPGGWAYRIGLPGATTIGVVHIGTNLPPLETAPSEEILGKDVAARWGVVGRPLTKVARRPAFAQSASAPVVANRLFAVGDAAFAPNPICGQGVLFALASALAVTTTIDAIHRGSDPESAVSYYREFVRDNVRRHLRFSREVLSSEGRQAPWAGVATWQGGREVLCRVPIIQHSVKAAERLITGPVLVLPSGELARWYGEIDLVVIAVAARSPVSLSDLDSHLCRCGWLPQEVRLALAWCLREGILQDRV